MTIEELCQRSYDVAVAKGWHEQKSSFGEAIALFHSEVSEALECYRDPKHQPGDIWFSEEGKPEGITIELADLLIRIGDTCGEMGIPLVLCLGDPEREVGMLGRYLINPLASERETSILKGLLPSREIVISEALSVVHPYLSKALEIWLEWKTFNLVECFNSISLDLANALRVVGFMCCLLSWDLDKAVLMKMKYNETRAYSHGGKRA